MKIWSGGWPIQEEGSAEKVARISVNERTQALVLPCENELVFPQRELRLSWKDEKNDAPHAMAAEIAVSYATPYLLKFLSWLLVTDPPPSIRWWFFFWIAGRFIHLAITAQDGTQLQKLGLAGFVAGALYWTEALTMLSAKLALFLGFAPPATLTIGVALCIFWLAFELPPMLTWLVKRVMGRK